jgi:hypothetical protein
MNYKYHLVLNILFLHFGLQGSTPTYDTGTVDNVQGILSVGISEKGRDRKRRFAYDQQGMPVRIRCYQSFQTQLKETP